MNKQLRGGRINRINPIIHQIVSNELLRNSDPVLNKSTITYVNTSPDLKRTTVFVSTIEKNKNQLLKSLDKNRLKIQKELANELRTKFIPKIQFKLDNTFDHVEKINEIIESIND